MNSILLSSKDDDDVCEGYSGKVPIPGSQVGAGRGPKRSSKTKSKEASKGKRNKNQKDLLKGFVVEDDEDDEEGLEEEEEQEYFENGEFDVERGHRHASETSGGSTSWRVGVKKGRGVKSAAPPVAVAELEGKFYVSKTWLQGKRILAWFIAAHCTYLTP